MNDKRSQFSIINYIVNVKGHNLANNYSHYMNKAGTEQLCWKSNCLIAKSTRYGQVFTYLLQRPSKNMQQPSGWTQIALCRKTSWMLLPFFSFGVFVWISSRSSSLISFLGVFGFPSVFDFLVSSSPSEQDWLPFCSSNLRFLISTGLLAKKYWISKRLSLSFETSKWNQITTRCQYQQRRVGD